MKAVTVYGLYKGDVFLDVGTADELSKKLGVKKETIMWYASPANKKRNSGNKIEAITFKEEAI